MEKNYKNKKKIKFQSSTEGTDRMAKVKKARNTHLSGFIRFYEKVEVVHSISYS